MLNFEMVEEGVCSVPESVGSSFKLANTLAYLAVTHLFLYPSEGPAAMGDKFLIRRV